MIAPQLKAILALGAWLVLAMVALLWAPNLRVL
jgi:hypothetical protein